MTPIQIIKIVVMVSLCLLISYREPSDKPLADIVDGDGTRHGWNVAHDALARALKKYL